MQSVSQTWEDVQEQYLVPESYVEIAMNVGDPDAQASASSSDNGHVDYSDSSSLVEAEGNDPALYATLEHNIWVLNGTFEILPDEEPYGENGYISDVISGDDGSFSTYPTITISFGSVFSALIPGLTITWSETYGEYASSFRITAYNGQTQTAQEVVEGNSSITSVVYVDIQNYDRITIEVLAWNIPNRRARVERVMVGIEKTYTKTDLMGFENTMMVDLLSAELPVSEITFQISNLNGEYNPDNPQGAARYLIERQSVVVRYGYKIDGKIEWIPAGTYYMSEWQTPQNGITATFTARDAQEYMTDLYTGTSSGTLMEIATAAFQQAELPAVEDGTSRWIIDSSLNSISVPDDVDLSDRTIGEVLQLVANAACCVFFQDRNGIVHIQPFSGSATDYEINKFNSYSNSELTLTKQLKAVNINNGQYVLNVGAVGETQNVSNPLISTERAQTVAQWVASVLQNRRILSGQFRADPRLDPLDYVTNINQFSTSDVIITQIQYVYNGAFRGNYEGRNIPLGGE